MNVIELDSRSKAIVLGILVLVALSALLTFHRTMIARAFPVIESPPAENIAVSE